MVFFLNACKIDFHRPSPRNFTLYNVNFQSENQHLPLDTNGCYIGICNLYDSPSFPTYHFHADGKVFFYDWFSHLINGQKLPSVTDEFSHNHEFLKKEEEGYYRLQGDSIKIEYYVRGTVWNYYNVQSGTLIHNVLTIYGESMRYSGDSQILPIIYKFEPFERVVK